MALDGGGAHVAETLLKRSPRTAERVERSGPGRVTSAAWRVSTIGNAEDSDATRPSSGDRPQGGTMKRLSMSLIAALGVMLMLIGPSATFAHGARHPTTA